MKTVCPFTLLAAVGVWWLPVSATRAQTALRTDTSGHLTAPLDLGDTHVIGTLDAARLPAVIPPAHLGTGTPTSATVLRGDGTWAGTTPTGNTLAATGNVLMGDSAGNAVAISSGADLHRVFKTRFESLQGVQTIPTNLLPPASNASTGTAFYGTLNADGTLTIPANGFVQWIVYGVPASTTLYGYMVATTEQPSGALALDRNDGFDRASTNSTLAPGVYRSTFTSIASTTDPSYLIVKNTTAAAITIYFPVLATQDTGLALLASYNDHVAVAPQPVADLDFTRFASADRSARYQLEQRTTLAADSVNGNDASAGTLYAPKVTLQQTAANGSVFGLYRGSLFRDSLPLGTLGTTHGIVVQDVALGSVKALPVVSAFTQAVNGSFANDGDGSYVYVWTPPETLANDGYSNVYVVEVNTATEAATPIAARRRMVDVASESAVSATPGSVMIQSLTGGEWSATIHPSDSLTPGSGSYRYEVVSRVQPANWGSYDENAGDGAMSGVELVGGSSGYGSLGAPRGFTGDRLAFVHGSTHNAVIGGGSLQRSVFYEGGNPAQFIQLAWYAGGGTGLAWATRHCLFYANVGDRAANCLISHTGNGSLPFDRGDLSDTAFLGARWSDGSLHGTAIDYVNVSTGVIERVYVQGIEDVFGTNMPLAAEVRSSVFRGVNQVRVGLNFHDNLVQTESGNDPANNNDRSPSACRFQQSGASATHNLFWAHGVTGVPYGDGAGGVQWDTSATHTNCTFARNVVVLDPAATNTNPSGYINPPSGVLSTLTMDYNLVINLSKNGFSASVGPAPGRTSWADYVAYEAMQSNPLDQHSLYVDLSADPRGVQAVFVDPANGDFRWAQTDVARRCAAYCKANGVGPAAVTSRWPLVPTVDEAVRLLTDL